MKKVFYNGTIYSLNKNNEKFELLSVNERGRIEFLGKNSDLKDFDDYQKIDLNKNVMLPGFIDSHLHMLNYAFIENSLKFFEDNSIKEVLKKVESLKSKVKEDNWIFGRGWNQEKFQDENRFLRKDDLDSISKDIPIFLIRVCGHIAVANTKALEKIIFLDKSKNFIDNIDIENGILREGAVKLCYDAMAPLKKTEIENLIKIAVKDLNKCGITSVHSDNFLSLPGKNYKTIIEAFKSLEDKNELTVRVCDQASFTDKKDLEEFLNNKKYSEIASEFYKIGPIKIYQDGSLGAKTALLREPYVNDEKNFGIEIHKEGELKDIIKIVHNSNRQIIVHTIGDKALEEVLDGVKEANEKYKRTNHRHGVVHAQITDLKLLKRLKKEEMIVYIQPVFMATDMDVVKKFIGEEREKNSYAWKTMKNLEIHISGGSDSPVESFNILENIQIGVTRKKLNNFPEKSWIPEEKLSVEEAVEIFTKEGAYASFEEELKGSLEINKYADLVVLDKDIYCVPDENIKNIKVLKTIINGKIVYEI